ncbi:MAG: redoxin domain-containing protein [Chloroflexota bacterium]|nr:redoxin domain-containing protein [Chloroflexota bacterium]
MVQLRDEYQAFRDAGAEVVAVAVAPVSAIDQGVKAIIDPPYPLLADPQHAVAEAFHVYDLFGDGLAAPSVFVIDTDGTIVWSYVGQGPGDRPSAQTVLNHIP